MGESINSRTHLLLSGKVHPMLNLGNVKVIFSEHMFFWFFSPRRPGSIGPALELSSPLEVE